MPKASAHKSASIAKALLMGDSGTGKTTALWSLARDGFKLRIWDYDNLLDGLIAKVRRECPDRLDNIEYVSLRDPLQATPQGPVCKGQPTAFVNGLKLLDKWEDGTRPEEWGEEYIIVIDSLTTMARAAHWWAKGLNGAAFIAEGVSSKGIRPEAIYHTAQQALMNTISALTAESCNANVIVLAHLKYMEKDGMAKGFPVALGSAISPEIPAYFPSAILAQRRGDKRTIRTIATEMVDLKNPRAFEIAAELPLDTGLSDFFKALRK